MTLLSHSSQGEIQRHLPQQHWPRLFCRYGGCIWADGELPTPGAYCRAGDGASQPSPCSPTTSQQPQRQPHRSQQPSPVRKGFLPYTIISYLAKKQTNKQTRGKGKKKSERSASAFHRALADQHNLLLMTWVCSPWQEAHYHLLQCFLI